MQNSSIQKLTKEQVDKLIKMSDWTHNGLPVIAVDRSKPLIVKVDASYNIVSNGFGIVETDQYAIAKDVREMDAAVASYLSENLWAYSPEWIAESTGIDKAVIEKLCGMGEKSNAALRAIIDGTCGFKRFVADALQTNGYNILPNFKDSGGELPFGYYFYSVD